MRVFLSANERQPVVWLWLLGPRSGRLRLGGRAAFACNNTCVHVHLEIRRGAYWSRRHLQGFAGRDALRIIFETTVVFWTMQSEPGTRDFRRCAGKRKWTMLTQPRVTLENWQDKHIVHVMAVRVKNDHSM